MTEEAARASNLGYRVLIKPCQVANTSTGGIILTPTLGELDLLQANNNIGVILEIGETAFHHERYGYKDGLAQAFDAYLMAVHNVPLPELLDHGFKVGDTVMFKSHSGHLFKYKDESGTETGDYFQILNDNDILMTMESKHE